VWIMPANECFGGCLIRGIGVEGECLIYDWGIGGIVESYWFFEGWLHENCKFWIWNV